MTESLQVEFFRDLAIAAVSGKTVAPILGSERIGAVYRGIGMPIGTDLTLIVAPERQYPNWCRSDGFSRANFSTLSDFASGADRLLFK